MDQLETLIFPSEVVKFGEQQFEVRGLGLAHIVSIVRQHRSVVADLYQQAISGTLEGSVEEVAMRMIDDFVPLASLVIATAMGSPSKSDLAAELPLSVQADALDKIFRLTVIGEGGLEKLMEIVMRAMAGAASLSSPRP